MTNALQKSLKDVRTLVNTVRNNNTLIEKSIVGDSFQGDGFSSLTGWGSNSKHKERYSLFRGITYSAINALASEGAKQPVLVGELQNIDESADEKLRSTKFYPKDKMPMNVREKATNSDVEIISGHAFEQTLDNPNPIQNKWQFTYCFISNLCLTGWGFIISDVNSDGKLELYAVPSTWVTPIHKKGPFAEFRIQNPKRPSIEGTTLSAENVKFAYLPNPKDPLTAMAPAGSQMNAIRVDDYIWSSRQQFFENGIFPGAIVTIGHDPHPDIPKGVRPRLSAQQRRGINGAIKKLMGGIANYGDPAIVDGLIESIEPLSMSSNEMGWDKSEESTKRVILSAFGVHPYILGEAVGVGGYAQVANIEKRFCARVNTYISALSGVLTNFARQHEQNEKLLIWLELCTAIDEQLDWNNYKTARSNGDITQNEYRAKLGLPPDDDLNQSIIQKQMVMPIVNLLEKKANGIITRDQAEKLLIGMGLPNDLAKEIAGEEAPPQPEEENVLLKPGGEEGKPPKLGKENEEEEIVEELKKAVDGLKRTNMDVVERVALAIINGSEITVTQE